MHKLVIVAALLVSTAAAQEPGSTDGADPTRAQQRASEGAITWTGPFDTESNLEVRPGGTLVEAVNATNTSTGSVTVNGVVFSNSAELLSASTNERFLDRATTRNPGYDNLLGSLDVGNGPTNVPLVVGKALLKPGNSYLIQVWYTDARSCCSNPRKMTFADGLGNTVSLNSYGAHMLGQYAVGWFIAAEESLHLTLDTAGTSGNAHINGYQIREVPLAAFEQMRRAGSLATETNDSVSSPATEKSYPGEVFDAEGKRIFYAEYGKHITAPDSPIYGPGRTYSEQILTHEASGRSFRLGQKRNEILSDGLVFMLYHFNDRHFEWIEAAGKMPLSTQTHEHDSAARVYEVTTPSAYQQAVSARYVDPRFEFWTVPEQGENPILAQEAVSANYLHGKFTSSKGAIKNFVFPEFTKSELMNDRFRLCRDEFGDPVYLIRGHLGADGNRTFGDWCDAVILHYYYEQNYQSTALESVKERRAVAAASLSESNSYAAEILNLSKKAETGATRVWG